MAKGRGFRRLLVFSLIVALSGGCSLWPLGDGSAESVYASPVERMQMTDSMDAHWGK